MQQKSVEQYNVNIIGVNMYIEEIKAKVEESLDMDGFWVRVMIQLNGLDYWLVMERFVDNFNPLGLTKLRRYDGDRT